MERPLQPSIKWEVAGRAEPNWMNGHTLCCGCECVSLHICTSACLRQSPNRSPWSQWWSRSPTQFPCSLTPSSEFLHTHTHTQTHSLLSLPFSPCPVLFPSPFSRSRHRCCHYHLTLFSAWPHPQENNYRMGTPCLNSHFEVDNSITFLLVSIVPGCHTCQRSSGHPTPALGVMAAEPALTEKLVRCPEKARNIVSMQQCFRVVITESVAQCWRMPAY